MAEALRQVPVDSIESTLRTDKPALAAQATGGNSSTLVEPRLSELDALWSWKVTKRRNHKCSTNANFPKPFAGVKGVLPRPCHCLRFPALFRVPKIAAVWRALLVVTAGRQQVPKYRQNTNLQPEPRRSVFNTTYVASRQSRGLRVLSPGKITGYFYAALNNSSLSPSAASPFRSIASWHLMQNWAQGTAANRLG